jgi:virginiamycin B lyase
MRRTLGFIAGAVIAAALLGGCGKTYPVGAVAPTPTPVVPSITSTYTIPTSASDPMGIASSASAVWFTEEAADKLAYLNQSAKIAEVLLPNSGSQPDGITFGPDSNIWFTEYGADKIGRYDPSSSTFAEFIIPTASSNPTSIVIGPGDSALWFTESATDKVGTVTLSGSINDFSLPAGTSTPLFATSVGNDGGIWFTLNGSDQIGEIVPVSDAISVYNVPTAASQPYGITYGTDHAIWFTEHATGKLGRLTTNGQFTNEITLTGCPAPGALQQGVDGKFYIFCTGASPSILQYDPQKGTMKTFALKSGSVPQNAIIAFDRKIYFTDSGLNAIEQFTYE